MTAKTPRSRWTVPGFAGRGLRRGGSGQAAGIVLMFATVLALTFPGCSDNRRPGPDPSSLLFSDSLVVFDHHVHLLSPRLIERWKLTGASFSKPDYAYSNIDSVLKFNGARKMFLISMAYLYGSPEFSDSSEVRSVMEENDYVAAMARKYPGRLFSFCSFHPLKDYAVPELLRCAGESGIYGLKLHFESGGVDLLDADHRRRVAELLSIAAGEQMPVLIHLGNSTEPIGEGELEMFIDSLLAPAPPLELYIAHLGGAGGYSMETRQALATFANAFRSGRDLGKHTVFFDISAVGLTEPAEEFSALTPDDWVDLSDRLLEIGLERVVYGSDYPVFNTAAYLHTLEDYLYITREELIGILGNGPVRTKSAGK